MAENNSQQPVSVEQLKEEIKSLRSEMNLLTQELDNAIADSRRGGFGRAELHRLTRELGLVKQGINRILIEVREAEKSK